MVVESIMFIEFKNYCSENYFYCEFQWLASND